MAQQQVTELWTQYGNLTRIWVDSGTDGLDDLMIKLQPQAPAPASAMRKQRRMPLPLLVPVRQRGSVPGCSQTRSGSFAWL